MRAKTTMMLVALLVLATSSLAGLPTKSDYRTSLRWDHYYDGPALEAALEELHEAFPRFTELRSLGKSEEGRDIWMLQINNPGTGKDLEKPGIYVDGSIHGNEIQAAEVCLYTAWYLLEHYGEIDQVTELVDNRAFYIVPVVNVDGRWRFFEPPSSYSVGRTAIVPYDDDRDGLDDEDDYEDIDGDGELLLMRIADPQGDYRTHPDDPRVMVRREPWEKGEWTLLGREGIDNDGDGRINEDPVGYLDMNRNWGYLWQPSYVQSGSGDFPFSALPTRHIVEFIRTKPNIAFDFAFHNTGGMWVRGPGSKLDGRYPMEDVKVYDFLGEEGERIVPGYRYIVAYKDMYTTYGDFDGFMYGAFGIYGFVGELWMSSEQEFRREEDEAEEDESGWGGVPDLERHRFDDVVSQGTMFRDWKTVEHPDLGEVQVGGWRTFTSRIGPTFLLHQMLHRNASMVLYTAGHAPEVQMELLEVRDIGEGLKRVRVRLTNENALPSLSAKAVKDRIVRQDLVTIEGRSLEVVSGGVVRDVHFDRVDPVENNPERIFTAVPSFGARDLQWVVRGSGEVTVRYDALKAANRELKLRL